MSRKPDLVVSIAPPGEPWDRRVAVIGDYVVDITGSTPGQVLTIQPDGSVAAENPINPDAMRFKGVIDASGNPNYPAALAGDVYRVSVAGKVGGASGTVVEVSDLVIALADNAGGTQAAVGASWSIEQGNITIDTDGTLAANSDALVPSQKAVKTYADAKVADAINDNVLTIAPSQNAVFEALALKAPLLSPAFTGNPTAPTASPGDNDTTIATTAFVVAAITASDTALVIDSIADADQTHAPSRNAVFDALALKANLASPQFSGTVGVGVAPAAGMTVNVNGPLRVDRTGVTTQTITVSGGDAGGLSIVARSSNKGLFISSLTNNGTAATSGNSIGFNLGQEGVDEFTAMTMNYVGVGAATINITGAVNIALATATGTKLGTGTTQKLGFWNATPVVQPAGTDDVLASLVTIGLRAASSNPPLNLGTGILTAGSTSAISHTQNGSTVFRIVNGSTGAAATALVSVGNNVGNDRGYLYQSGGNFTPTAGVVADQTLVAGVGAGGLLIQNLTTQKLGFYGAATVVQPAGAGQAAVATTGATSITPFGYTTAAQADAIVTLVNALRLALVNLGLIKGAA